MSSVDSNEIEQEAPEELLRLIGTHLPAIRHFVATLVPNAADADDLVQETCITLWRKFEEFDQSRDFYRWACGIAFILVRRHRRASVTSRLWFSEDVLQLLSEDLVADKVTPDNRATALSTCLQSLSKRDHTLLSHRYRENLSVQQISEAASRPASTIYKRLIRIRSALADCITLRLAQEHHPGG